jgi:colanic acid/amylovoran biosynthesis glycosyltransferase
LKLLCWAGNFVGIDPDIWHCHFGKVAADFVILREVLGLKAPILTSFYGFDVSQVPQHKGVNFYDELKTVCHSYIVMSNDMKRRVVGLGFKEQEIHVLPVGIDTAAYPYRERADHTEPVKLATVARLVEKKGIDDLLRALAWCKDKSERRISCDIVGDGPLRQRLHDLAGELGVREMVGWKGFMRQEDMIEVLASADIYVQPSKTAANGDME